MKCSLQFGSMAVFDMHISLVHKQNEEIEYNLVCKSEQNEKITPVKDINIDAKKEEKKKTVKCELCDKNLSSNFSLKIHIANVHEKEKPYECNICGAKFTQKISLNGHINAIHEGTLLCVFYLGRILSITVVFTEITKVRFVC